MELSHNGHASHWIFRSIAWVRSGLWCWGCWSNRKCLGDPLQFGTAASKEAASTAAEQFVRSEFPRSTLHNEKPWKARRHYDEHVRPPATVIYCRCATGKGKWFWCCWRWKAWLRGNRAFAAGHADSSQDAEALAVAACEGHFPHEVCELGPATAAAQYRRRLLAEPRAARTTTSTETQPFDFVYTDDVDGSVSFPHRIVKKTKRRVVVEAAFWADARQVFSDWWDFVWTKHYCLDRTELEREGSVWSQAAGRFFYSVPCEERMNDQPALMTPEVQRR